MGVDIRDIVKATRVTLEQLSGMAIAIDAYNALYQFLAIIRGEVGEHLRDHEGRVTSHLSGLFYRNINFLMIGIKPVYILDGQPPTLKFMEIERRKAVKQQAVIKYLEALSRKDYEAAKKYAQATSIIKDYMVEDTKRILDLMGIPWIEAPSEGEATAAYLTQVGLASATASQDFDSLLFGATQLIRNLTISGRRKLPGKKEYVDIEPEKIELDRLIRELGITREQLVDIGILVGTDYNPDGFKGIGPVKALKLIKHYGRLENIPEIQDALSKIDYEAIRQIFLKPSVVKPSKLEWRSIDTDGLIHFLCDERDFSKTRVMNALEKLKEAQRKRSESLERWFDG
ncbi:MAG: flap endonuclease-1 [Nitrososphaerota archaeon]|nr:flap endonuclease-1 [Nitrososphaerales archaeon]MDW8045494.1 flap endonuclease-1 [Nitrososphaerota archaeon]